MLTLGQAARLAKTSKTSIGRAIKGGRLSATRREDGGYAIDPSELARVFEVTPDDGHAPVTVERRETPAATPVTDGLALRLAVAETELKALKDMVINFGPLATPGRLKPSVLRCLRRLQRPRLSYSLFAAPGGNGWPVEFDANQQEADSGRMTR